MIEDKVNATGELQIVLRDAEGNIKDERTVPNLVVTIGKTVIASRLTGVATAVMSHMAIGSNNVAPIAANTTLGVELARVALGTAGGAASSNQVTFTATFAAGVGTGAITEAGVLNAATVGSMLCRTVFGVVNKDVGDSLSIVWVVTIN